jgi:hypothetical protein
MYPSVLGVSWQTTPPEDAEVAHHRYLVRIASGNIENWYKPKPDINLLIKNAFERVSESAHSVYEVSNAAEECLAVAATALTNPKISLDAKTVLRIEVNELEELGITVDSSELGETGVPGWDFRHRNLVADRDGIVRLVELLIVRCHQGFDRARRVYLSPIKAALTAICAYPPSRCPEHVKAIARWCQDRNNDSWPKVSPDKIAMEIGIVEFDDEVVLPLAHELSTGDCHRDWYESVNSLRRNYVEHYVRAMRTRGLVV